MRVARSSARLWLVLEIAVAAVLAVGLVGFRPARAAAKVKLTMFIWAGANQGVVPREVVARYLKAHPDVEIEFWESTNAATYPKMLAAKQANPNAPLVNFGYFNVDLSNRGDTDDMWVPMEGNWDIPAMARDFRGYQIDREAMAMTENPRALFLHCMPAQPKLPPALRRPENRGLGFSVSHVGLMYNRNLVKDPPTSWTALWDPKWQGKVTFFDNNFVPLVLAARLNGGNEQSVDPGFRLWAEHARNIRALPTTNDALKNIIVTGEAQIAPWFAGIWKFWADEGADVSVLPLLDCDLAAVKGRGPIDLPDRSCRDRLSFEGTEGSVQRLSEFAFDHWNVARGGALVTSLLLALVAARGVLPM